ncbi:Cof-like hydrolase [Alicyclobacillus hesperidum URH17-3-68]|nr:Cof-like hydrolase [Alicyclobacillus hesperidum URH17-3-68]
MLHEVAANISRDVVLKELELKHAHGYIVKSSVSTFSRSYLQSIWQGLS